jgi:hypothetical protein
LIAQIRGSHQSSGLSEISSQFHDEWSAVPGASASTAAASRAWRAGNLVFGPGDVHDRVQADRLGAPRRPSRRRTRA